MAVVAVPVEEMAAQSAEEQAEGAVAALATFTANSDAELTETQVSSRELEQLERILREDLRQAIVWSQWDEYQPEQESPAVVVVGVAGA